MMDPGTREKLLEAIQNDLKSLSLETKKSKSLQPLRESADEAINRLRGCLAGSGGASGGSLETANPSTNVFVMAHQVLCPLIQGCETKDAKIVRLCMGLAQRLIVSKVIDFKGARLVVDSLWMLMECGIEEVKILQTVTLLVTSSHVAQNETLARCLVICFRLHFTKDQTVNTIAGATIRQLVPCVLERASEAVSSESDATNNASTCKLCLQHAYEEPSPRVASQIQGIFAKGTNPFLVDAYLMFRDIVLLVGADQPQWMVGIAEMTRTFGLELLESLLTQFPNVFVQNDQFRSLLKEKVCSLVIKLFSPNVKSVKGSSSSAHSYYHHQQGVEGQEKPSYPITSKLLRVVAVLVLEYHHVLTTETEIFLSLVMKFLDPDKPTWQNGSALEVIHKILVKPRLIQFICSQFDMNGHSASVFRDIINGLGAFVQNILLSGPVGEDWGASGGNNPGGVNTVPHSSSGNFYQQQGSSVGVGGPSNSTGSMYNNYGPGVTAQPGFSYRNVWKPLTISFIGGQTKELYLEVADRGEIPVVSDGYCISLAYVCLLEVVRSLSILIDGDKTNSSKNSSSSNSQSCQTRGDEDEACIKQLLESTWCGILSALSLLLDASTDDASTENILKQLEMFASFCGRMGLSGPRDAYLAAVCKASLPPHYTLNVLKATPSTQNVSGPSRLVTGVDPVVVGSGAMENDIRHQVVAVGTPLPTSSLPSSAHQGPVMLTAKNLQCMRAILSVAHCHGNILGTSWHIILTTLQHLVWILGLKPVTGGALSSATGSASQSDSSSSVITTAVMADLPILSNMVSRLFESSTQLTDSSLNHLIDALCHLSEESMELASANREPSLFAVAKLLETASVNLESRVEVVWRPITGHLLLVCQHPHLRMRQWGCEAVTFLTRQAVQRSSLLLRDNNRIQTLLLSPLAELSAIPYPDVRQKQLDTVLHVLHTSGASLSYGWPLILTMIGSLDMEHSDILVRSAFQCLQLVFTDFLPTIPYRCYPLCVETATKFGAQKAELNVSLTAVGLLWNLSDYFYQNLNPNSIGAAASSPKEEKPGKDLAAQSKPTDDGPNNQPPNQQQVQGQFQIFPECFLTFPGCKNISSFDKLWMCLYCRLKDLCLDPRPAVRKSSGQTLFSTLAAHGSILEANTWQAVLWQVLFPLLDNVIIQSDNASTEKVTQQNSGIMIHHSRNTAQKQWAETKVLTISGVVRVFNAKRKLLLLARSSLSSAGTAGGGLGSQDYSKAWVLLLEYVEKMALSDTTEVSLAALKALQEMITSSSSFSDSSEDSLLPPQLEANWKLCWKAWLNIGTQKASYMTNTSEHVPHSQVLLTGFVQIFQVLFPHLKGSFRREDVENLGKVLLSCVLVPVDPAAEFDALPPAATASSMTVLQSAVLESLSAVRRVALTAASTKGDMQLIAEMFEVLFTMSKSALMTSASLVKGVSHSTEARQQQEPSHQQMSLRYKERLSVFGEACLEELSTTFQSCHEDLSAKGCADAKCGAVLFKILSVLRIPLQQKYRCFLQSNWRMAVNVLIGVLRVGIPVARKNCRESESVTGEEFSDFWTELAATLENFLFPESAEEQRQEDRMADEAVDCHLIELLRAEVLPFPSQVPTDFIRKMVVLLNKGSIHSSMTLSDDCSGSIGLREDFAKQCFETLLEFSLLDPPGSNSTTGAGSSSSTSVTNRLAITSLLQRFKEVLHEAIDGEKLNRNIPLQRQKTAEISFVLKAIGTVISSMKRAPPQSVTRQTWHQIIGLYPYLVQFTETSSPLIGASVKDALLEYYDLLRPYDVGQGASN